MLTNEEAEYLINLDKTLKDPLQIVDLSIKKNRIDLISHQDTDYNFWVEITSNHKIILKTSIHHLESNSYIGLLRIDFKGGHHNPPEVKNSLPDYLTKYADKWFTPEEPHMHVYVEGYKPLVWAIPLEDTDFPVKNIDDISDLNDLIVNFAKKINLNSNLHIQQAIL